MPNKIPRTRNGGKWTESRFNSFIKGGLRRMTTRWGPIQQAKKDARKGRGEYLCAECGQIVPATIPSKTKTSKTGKPARETNIFVDHKEPIIDPTVGFVSWDEVIERMFVEAEGLQVLCKTCHDIKTTKERDIAKQRRRNGE